MEQQVRIDKFLWSIRVYKTRTEAADACRSGKVSVNGAEAKASRDVKAGDTVSVRKGSVHFQYRVIVPIGNRVGAKLVPEFAEDITPPGGAGQAQRSLRDRLYPPRPRHRTPDQEGEARSGPADGRASVETGIGVDT